jgi:hypothetical protein
MALAINNHSVVRFKETIQLARCVLVSSLLAEALLARNRRSPRGPRRTGIVFQANLKERLRSAVSRIARMPASVILKQRLPLGHEGSFSPLTQDSTNPFFCKRSRSV